MRLRPGFADAFFYLGAIYEKRGQLDHAIEFFTHALTVREGCGGGERRAGVMHSCFSVHASPHGCRHLDAPHIPVPCPL